MKRVFIFIIIVCVFLVIYSYLKHIPIPSKKLPTSVTIIALPSPPHYKTIIDTENIEWIFSFIKESDLKPIINNGKGWQVSLKYNGGTIVILENKIEINGRWFKANNNISAKFMEFYQALDYKEELWK